MATEVELLRNLTFSSEGALEITPASSGKTAFGLQRVASPSTLFDSKQILNDGIAVFWNQVTNGTALIDYDATNSESVLSVATTGDYAIRQTKQHFNYEPGKGQLIYMTGSIEPQTGVEKKIGYCQGDTSAPYIESATGVSVAITKNSTSNAVNQASWNRDKLDGTGPSGITADWSKPQIFFISFAWLGLGNVSFGLKIGGDIVICHVFENENNNDNVYMRSSNQPVRYEIRSTGGAGSMQAICCSVQSEGGYELTGIVASLDTNGNLINIGTSLEMIIAIRLKPDQLDAAVMIERVNALSTTNENFKWALLFNPVIAGTPAWVDAGGSAVQVWFGDGTNTVTPNIQMDSGFVSNNVDRVEAQTRSNLMLGSNIDGTQDVIALCLQTVAQTGDFVGGLTVRQLL
jgi:hypothetical protein